MYFYAKLKYTPTLVAGSNNGILCKDDEVCNVISSLGGHSNVKLLSMTKACPSLHSYALSVYNHIDC